MKKSRITKLALSGAAVAALAATFSTSTYAWYVSNKTANVEAVAGSTASSGAGSSISLSATGQLNDYHKTISLADKENGLYPVVRTGATIGNAGTTTAVYKVLDETQDADTETTNVYDVDASTTVTTEGSYYYEYRFYIKADTACTVRPTITVTNTTGTLPTQINYSGGYQKVTGDTAPTWATNTYYSQSSGVYTLTASQPTDWEDNYANYYTASANKVTGVNPGADFCVDALKATYMSLGVLKGTSYANTTSFSPAANATASEYSDEVKAITNYMKVNAGTAPSGIAQATGGAQAYYEDLTGYKLTSAAKTTYDASNSFADLSLDANTPYLLVYHLWLDGADDQCFNACAGQTFSVAFDYTVTAANSGN